MGDPQKGIEGWRDSNVNRVRRLQEAGMLREGLDAEELLAAIGALVLGAATRLLGNASEASAAKELRMLDAFVDSLEISDPVCEEKPATVRGQADAKGPEIQIETIQEGSYHGDD